MFTLLVWYYKTVNRQKAKPLRKIHLSKRAIANLKVYNKGENEEKEGTKGMTKEELKVLIEDLKDKANEEETINNKIITDKLQSYTDKKIRVSISWSYYDELSLEVEFWNEAKGKWDFGSTFKLYYYNKIYRATREREAIEISTGTIGSYSKREIYQIARIKMLSNLWDDVDNLTEMFDNLKHTMSTIYREKMDALRDIEYAEKCEAEDKARREIKAKLVPGTEMIYGCRKIKITKVTSKRTYYAPWVEYNVYNKETDTYGSEFRYSNYEQFKNTEDMISSIYYDMYYRKNDKCKFLENEEA